MKRLLWAVFNSVFIIMALSIRPAPAQSNPEEKIKNVEEIRDSRTRSVEEEIKTVNLLNNLNLNKDQLEYVIRQTQGIEATRKQVYAGFKRYSGKMLDLEEQIKRQVEDERIFLDNDLVNEYRQVKKECDLLFFKLNNRIKEGIRSVEANLKDFQLVALDNYIPCVVPIVRESLIGGSDKAIFLTSIFMIARVIPAERYEIEKDQYISARISELKKNIVPCKKLCPDNIAREEISRAIDQMRAMDEVDFQLKVNAMAEELGQKIILQEPEISRQDKIQRFLLSAKNIPVLEKRLRRK